VQGAATTRTLPDRAELHLQVSHLDPDPVEALRVASAKADAVAAVLRDHDIPDTGWHTAAVRVGEEWRWEDGKAVSSGQRAAARFDVTIVDDLTGVGGLVSAAVAAGAEVVSQEWTVTPDNAGRLDAYRRAALDARARADAYAGALGLVLGPVLRIDEVGDARPTPMPRMMAMAAQADDEDGGPETVHLGEVTVDATVTVTFALDGPS
jgi:uncharacterized protein YggE